MLLPLAIASLALQSCDEENSYNERRIFADTECEVNGSFEDLDAEVTDLASRGALSLERGEITQGGVGNVILISDQNLQITLIELAGGKSVQVVATYGERLDSAHEQRYRRLVERLNTLRCNLDP